MPERALNGRALSGRAQDRLAVALLGLGALLCHGGPVIARLGFYHDDWALLKTMAFHGGGLWELLSFQLDGTGHLYRPLAVFCWTIPYWLFGLNPLPWHLLMAALTWALGSTLFLVLRLHGASRLAGVGASLLFMAFPNKDATVFWPDVALILSTALLLFLWSYHQHARYLESGGAGPLWRSAAFLLLSLCAYDQAFLLLPVWLLAPLRPGPEGRARLGRSAAVGAAVVALVGVYKHALLPLWVPAHKQVAVSLEHAFFVYAMALRALADPRWLLYLLRCAWEALTRQPALAAAAAALPLAAWLSLRRGGEEASPGASASLLRWGAAVAVLGYLPFCFSDYAPAAYDHMNRLNQLPAVGLAALACGWALAAGGRTAVRLGALSAAAAFCLVVHVAFAEIWAESYRRQLAVRDQVLAGLSSWDGGKTLLVRLEELYVARKAPVFLTDYDVTGALQVWTGDSLRRGTAYTQWVRARPDHLEAPGGRLPYGSVALLDMTRRTLGDLDARQARALPPVLHPRQTPLRFW